MSGDDFPPGRPGTVFDPAARVDSRLRKLARHVPNLKEIAIAILDRGPREAPDIDKLIGSLGEDDRKGLGKWDLGIDGGRFGLEEFITEWGLDPDGLFSGLGDGRGIIEGDPRDALDGGLGMVSTNPDSPAAPSVPPSAGAWRMLITVDDDTGQITEREWAHFNEKGQKDTKWSKEPPPGWDPNGDSVQAGGKRGGVGSPRTPNPMDQGTGRGTLTREDMRRLIEGGWRPNYASDGPIFGGDDDYRRGAGITRQEFESSIEVVRGGGVTDPVPYGDPLTGIRSGNASVQVKPTRPASDDPKDNP